MRLLVDEMFSPAVAAGLRTRGHDAVSVHDGPHGLVTGAADADVLAIARQEQRALVAENVRDYRPLENALLADGLHHAGFVYTSNRQFPRGDAATVGRLIRALNALLQRSPDLRNRSIFLTGHD